VTDTAELRELVATAGRILHRLGMADYLGHTSARIPGTDQIVVKPKHSPSVRGMHALTADQMIVVDPDGRLAEGTDRAPEEVFIHTEIYRARPDVAAVVHTHQPVATLMGVMSAPVLPILHLHAAYVETDVPIWPHPILVRTAELGGRLAAALGDHSLCHLQGHGIVSVAGDVREAVVRAVLFEQLAEANLTVLKAGGSPRVIPAEEIAELRRHLAPVDGRWAYYQELI
jgi:ribulose-5-phosphate 4-epimerase/fuculose-1-phosphate aldolase